MEKKKRNILFINYEYPPLGGGGGNANKMIAERMAKQEDVNVRVLTSSFKGLESFENLNGVEIRRIPTFRKHKEKCGVFEMCVFLMMSCFYSIIEYFRFKPNFTICFFSIPSGPAAMLLRILFRVPYVVALRGGDVPGFLPEQLKNFHRVSNWLNWLVWKFSDCITTNSQGLADLALKFFPGKALKVIPNGVDSNFFYQRQNEAKKNLTVLMVGRLSQQKKAERLIQSMNRLLQKGYSQIRLILVGDGPEREKLESLAVSNDLLDQNVVFAGWCDRDKITKQYASADVFALASDYEGMPNAMLEAMASSMAIVATNAPGTDELVEDGKNGFLIEKNYLEGFDDAFIRLANDENLLERLQKGSFAKAKNYTWEKVTQMYYDLTLK